MASAPSAIGTAWIQVALTFDEQIKKLSKGFEGVGKEAGEDIGEGIGKGAKESAKKGTEEGLGDVDVKKSGIGKKIGLAAAAGFTAAAAGIAAGAKEVYAIGDTFQQSYAAVRASTGATGAELDALNASVRNVAKETPVGIETIGETLATVNKRLDLTGGNLETVTGQFLLMGKAGTEVDLGLATGALKAWNIESDKTPEALDKLFRVSQQTGIEFNELNDIIGRSAPVAKEMGMGFEDAAVLAGQLNKAGIDSQQIFDAMKGGSLTALGARGEEMLAMQETVQAGLDAQKEVEELQKENLKIAAENRKNPKGAKEQKEISAELLAQVEAGKAAAKNYESMAASSPSILETFQASTVEIEKLLAAGKRTEAMTIASEIFGEEDSWAFMNALEQGILTSEAFQSTLVDTGDTIAAAAGDTETFSDKWLKFKNNAFVALEPLAMTVFGGLADAFESITPKLVAFTEWAKENPGTIKAIAIGIGIATGALGLLAGALTVAAAAQWVMNAALLANPITWIVVGIGAIIAAIVVLAMNWKSLTYEIGVLFQGLKTWFAEAGATIGEFFTGMWTKIKEIWNNITDFFSGLINSAATTTEGIIANIAGVVENVKTKIGEIIENVRGAIAAIPEFVTGAFKGAANYIIGFFNFVVDGMNKLLGGLNKISFTLPSALGGGSFGVNIPLIPNIPELATGADIMGPTIALLGEKEPETVVNRGGVNRLIESVQGRLDSLPGGGGAPIYITVNPAQGMSEEELANKVARRVSWVQKR